MTAPDPDLIRLAAELRAQGWRRVEIVPTARGPRIILEDASDEPRREVTSGRKRRA